MVVKKGGIKAGQTEDEKLTLGKGIAKAIKRSVPFMMNIPKFKKGGKVKKKGKK